MIHLLATQRLQELFSGQIQSTLTNYRGASETPPTHYHHTQLEDHSETKLPGSKRLNGLQVPVQDTSSSLSSQGSNIPSTGTFLTLIVHVHVYM